MDNNLGIQIFSHEIFGSVKTIDEDGKIWFCGIDVARALGYKSPKDAIAAHCRWAVKRPVPHPQSKNKTILMSFIPEGDLYRLIAHSKLPLAQQFESWIFDEVLVKIRKNGGYIAGQENMSNEEILAKAMIVANNIIEEKNKLIAKQEEQLKLQEPLYNVGKKLTKSEDDISVGEFAKVLLDDDTDIGRNRLFKYFRERGIFDKDNIPYQKYMSKKYFSLNRDPITIGGKIYFVSVTSITPKGQEWIINNKFDDIKNFMNQNNKKK